LKEVTVSCLGFVYGCLTGSGPSPRLIEQISEFLAGERLLIIFNDSPSTRVEAIVDDLDLSGRKNVFVCTATDNAWTLWDTNSNRVMIAPPSASLGDALGNIQKYYGLSEATTLTVGVSAKHFSLKDHSTLHFHVGSEESLTRRVRGLIPLTGQFEFGLINIINYFTQNHYSDSAIECQDLIQFVESSSDLFRRTDAAWVLAEKHVRASRDLANAFPDDIVAIFGTGFPFYLSADSVLGTEVETPGSILSYFDKQFDYFRSKLIDEKTYLEHYTTIASVEEMAGAFGVNVLRNEFDNYKYQQMNCAAPADVEGRMRIGDYYAQTCFDVASDIWPCFYCVPLQSQHRFPNQATLKHTNTTCLPCKQTSLKLRNVMSCTPDIDVVIVGKQDKSLLAEKVNRYVLNQSSFYLYDTDFYRTLVENDGPIDLFVTDVNDLTRALSGLVCEDWDRVMFDSIALWSPSVNFEAQLGISFPLAFEPVLIKDKELLRKLLQVRKQFAVSFSTQEIAERLRHASFYTAQLMTNSSIVAVMEKKLERWRE
jgi:hypothetical protein